MHGATRYVTFLRLDVTISFSSLAIEDLALLFAFIFLFSYKLLFFFF